MAFAELCSQRLRPAGGHPRAIIPPPYCVTKHANCTFITSSQPLCFVRTALQMYASIGWCLNIKRNDIVEVRGVQPGSQTCGEGLEVHEMLSCLPRRVGQCWETLLLGPCLMSAHGLVLQRNHPQLLILALKVVFAGFAGCVVGFFFLVDWAVQSQCCRNTAGCSFRLPPSCPWQPQL